MTTTQDTGSRSPWISIWLSPRQTIDHILATGPRRFVWLLAALGTIASIYSQALSFGFLDGVAGWRAWLSFLAGSAVIGILFLYLNALILRGVGSLIGGRASTLELRAGAGLECGTGDPRPRHRRAARCRGEAFWRGERDVAGRIFAAAADHRCRGRPLVVRRRAADAFARRTLRVLAYDRGLRRGPDISASDCACHSRVAVPPLHPAQRLDVSDHVPSGTASSSRSTPMATAAIRSHPRRRCSRDVCLRAPSRSAATWLPFDRRRTA